VSRNSMLAGVKRLSQGLRWRLGLRVAASELEAGTDENVASFYSGRITDCAFLDSAEHYEHPRARWILDCVAAGRLLEIGCGNGGMTRLLAEKVDSVIAVDVSKPSLEVVNELRLPNVRTAEALIEDYEPPYSFDWIVVSEVIEHLRRPGAAIARCLKWLAPGGSLLVTTPNGHWESDEHLHVFSLASFSALLIDGGAEDLHVAYLRDVRNRRRWITGQVTAPQCPGAPDPFWDRRSTAAERRRLK
jgi:2-polyprenyl-3-methyl-5-hydroxy-6-metoxy-1,4-benzoquinol methylase